MNAVAPSGVPPYVVLELLEGTPLDEDIRRRRHGQAPPLSLAELRAIFEPVLDALAFAHARGIVHRDIKPSNIMVLRAPDGALTAEILDFGMAAGAPDMATTTGAGLTPLYAAPEQWNAQYGTVVENRVALWPHIDSMDGGPAYVKIALRSERGGAKK